MRNRFEPPSDFMRFCRFAHTEHSVGTWMDEQSVAHRSETSVIPGNQWSGKRPLALLALKTVPANSAGCERESQKKCIVTLSQRLFSTFSAAYENQLDCSNFFIHTILLSFKTQCLLKSWIVLFPTPARFGRLVCCIPLTTPPPRPLTQAATLIDAGRLLKRSLYLFTNTKRRFSIHIRLALYLLTVTKP